jgi:dinuclear metal center YbgI/SA1388 family protein
LPDVLSLADVIAAMDSWFPPGTAEPWDAVGLTCGDRSTTVERIVLAVDCVPATVSETVEVGAQLLLTHHPLLLTGVHSVAVDDVKGAMVHRMISTGIAHFAAHTNADVARCGVSESLARTLGLTDLLPLAAAPAPALDQLTVFVPADHLGAVIEALTEAGAGKLGNYDQCTFTVEGTGTYRPGPGAEPFDGELGVLTRKAEQRLSMVLPRARRAQVLAAMRAAHPYEEIAFELTEQPALASGTGTGRIGLLDRAMSLADFTAHAVSCLPRTAWGVRAAGDPDRTVRRVAVCGGAGDSYIDLARAAGADVFLTSDLKHHRTLEAVTERAQPTGPAPMALVDAAHWATERPWLDTAAGLLAAEFGSAVDLTVSDTVTDPWSLHVH